LRVPVLNFAWIRIPKSSCIQQFFLFLANTIVLMVVLVDLVRTEDTEEVVVGNARELKGVTAKKITWKKDGVQIVFRLGQ